MSYFNLHIASSVYLPQSALASLRRTAFLTNISSSPSVSYTSLPETKSISAGRTRLLRFQILKTNMLNRYRTIPRYDVMNLSTLNPPIKAV